MTRPSRVDHAAVARALAEANAKTKLFAKGGFMHDTPERTPGDSHDPLGRAVIEAARAWFAADMDTDAQAGDRLSAAVRAYEAAGDVELRRHDDAV